MKKALRDSLKYAGLFVFLVFMFACSNGSIEKTGKAAVKYTCPMHPQIVTEEPGACPICGMDLVPAKSHDADDTVTAGLEDIIRPVDRIVLSNIRTVRPSEGVRTGDIQIQGIINYDTNNWNTVSSRVSGRIERLYVTYNYQYVRRGQKLMDIYSPDLASAQQELLYLRKSGDKALLEAAKTKLRVLGASNQQINTVLRTGKINYRFGVYSPYSGYVTQQRTASVADPAMQASGTVIGSEGAESSMGGMGGQSAGDSPQLPKVETNSPLQLREGQYIGQGQKIIDLINASSVFADFFASTKQLSGLKRGTPVQITSIDNPSQKALAKITLIQPYYAEGTSFPLLRTRINNAGQTWKIGQLITVKTDADSKFGTWLPRTAVLQLGSRYVAFVKNGEAFEPAYVSLLDRRGDWVDVGESISKKAEVAVNAWFMVDSESFVKVDSLRN
ncbi:efflux RND transporter periplasmic adaptor subunit [Paradesertivirga mongoliensis]|uniref:Efflux RND transporter periplasmic adaptor subunit n=1 Tax=Paradesertivirga mongoliensis TaxID=2100740 RepID=A0ABW4ZKL2_9SPHI|nr:efflux RND transporter periplasmic adaptor subunit [Pedobacter mongoliensis]